MTTTLQAATDLLWDDQAAIDDALLTLETTESGFILHVLRGHVEYLSPVLNFDFTNVTALAKEVRAGLEATSTAHGSVIARAEALVLGCLGAVGPWSLGS